MDITSFLNPNMFKKIELLPPDALKYLLKQIDNMSDEHPKKRKMSRIADIATKTLVKQGELQETKVRQYNLRRYFYLPFSRILFNGILDETQPGRLSRHSMGRIWNYLQFKLMPEEVQEFEASFNVAVQQKETKKARIIVNEFNRLAGQKLEEVIENCKDDEREWARFSMTIGDKLVAEEAKELAYYLQNTAEVEKAIKFFATDIVDLSGTTLSKITNEVLKIKQNQPKMFPIYIGLLIDCLKHPAHILRIIIKHYRIDDASAAAKCDLSILGDILLFNAKIELNIFIEDSNSQEKHEQYLQHYINYATIIMGLEREFEVSPISSWGKEIIELKAAAAESLEKDIMTCPRLLKDVLGRYQKIADGIPVKNPEEAEIGKLNASIFLLQGVKNHIAAASCNAVFSENYQKCEQFINVFSTAIVEQMRRESAKNRQALLVYLQISAGLIKIIKDPEQADVYLKSGLLAIRE